jgi:hypothetical protein
MRTIRKLVKFEYNNKLYDTKKKAIEANENDINKMVLELMKEPMTGNYSKDSYRITEFILSNRDKIKDLLDLEFDTEYDDD